MKAILLKIRAVLRSIFVPSAFAEAARRWSANGHPLPYAAAVEELVMRERLEEFRDWASDAYLSDQTRLLHDLQEEWVEANLKPMAAVYGQYKNVGILKNVIRDMPVSEAFHPEAYKAWVASADRMVASNLGKLRTPAGR